MTWMLIGLVLTSLIIGSLSTIFGTEFVYDPQPIDTDGKVNIQGLTVNLLFVSVALIEQTIKIEKSFDVGKKPLIK